MKITCDLIKVSTTVTIAPFLAVVERLYGAPMSCGARRDLALESGAPLAMHMHSCGIRVERGTRQ